jgi:hypothetical protein
LHYYKSGRRNDKGKQWKKQPIQFDYSYPSNVFLPLISLPFRGTSAAGFPWITFYVFPQQRISDEEL